MQISDTRGALRVNFRTLECEIPPDERHRLQDGIDRVASEVERTPAELDMQVVFHSQTDRCPDRFHAEARLRLPGRTLFTGDWDPYLDTALQRTFRKLLRKIEAYKATPVQPAKERAEAVAASFEKIVAPEDPDAGPLAEAARNGDYRSFRGMLAGYEDWLNDRVGRWVQRNPELDERIGDDVMLSDLADETFLNAFERYSERPAHKPLQAWLDELIDPSIQEYMRDPDAERANVGFARSAADADVDDNPA